MLVSKVCKILVDENIFTRSEFPSLNRIELTTKCFYLDIPIYLKSRPYACLSRRACFYQSTHPLIYLYHLPWLLLVMYFLCVCLCFVCLCVANDYFRPWPAIIGCF